MKLDPEPEDPARRGMDYKESYVVSQVHAAIVREKDDPDSGLEPIPPWLAVFIIAVAFLSGGYLFQHSGGFKVDAYEGGGSGSSGAGAGGAGAVKAVEDPVKLGQRYFNANCVSCHQAGGTGVPAKYPPLAQSKWVTGAERRLAAIVLNGLEGPVTVNGVTFNGSMPAWKRDLNDKKIAYILTYIRSAWGHQAPAVTPDRVASFRAEYGGRREPWTESAILALPE